MTRTTWLFGPGGIGALLEAGATADQLNGSYSIERTSGASYRDSSRTKFDIIPVYRFPNLSQTIQTRPVGFKWGLYAQDMPAGQAAIGNTPEIEIEDYRTTHRIACENISEQGLRPIVFPSPDIMNVLDPTLVGRVGAPQAFLQRGVTTDIVTYAEAVGVQSQALTGDVTAFAGLLEGAHEQLLNVRTLPFFGGLTTNWNGVTFTSKQLLASWQATRDLCTGYWLDTVDPGVVVDFLTLAGQKM